MMSVIVWSKENCPSCTKAKTLLDNRKIPFEVRQIGEEWTREQLLEAVPTARSVPQIMINGQSIGGYEELVRYMEDTGYNGTGHSL
jgi:glutaredoxin 3